ncbi:MAG: molybdopterin dinucleotide binding domain-containing protein, partial [Actinomycetota bacterium]|nr:molybdopterin dinucleotide binding domain-containing protein [Actinomycetota bacterium]
GPRVVAVPSRQFVDTFPGDGTGAGAGDGAGAGGDAGRRATLADPHQSVPRYVPLAHAADALTLISPATSKLVNSMFGEFQSPSPAIVLHHDDAAARGLHAGQDVRVTSPIGSITVPLEVNADTRPGVAVMSKGVWLRHHADGHGVNTLTPATGDAFANGACFNDTFVQVAPAE